MKTPCRRLRKSSCDSLFTFAATTPTGGALRSPAQLKNKLIFAGYPENRYLAFSSSASTVTIDPTYGLNDNASSSAGTCMAACVRMSSADATGQCCSCGGLNKRYSRSTFNANTFLCK
jgi:hypothetical protein